jgi:hypothetical protein
VSCAYLLRVSELTACPLMYLPVAEEIEPCECSEVEGGH